MSAEPDISNPLSKAEPVLTMERGVTLKGGISANVLNMVGVGPFITIPLALAAMGGPQAMLGWILGGLIALCDGLVWAELGSAMPHSGGPYHYLREAFGPLRLGNLLSFLFVWQTILVGPLTIASGAVGFAQYAKYLFPSLHGFQLPLLAALICLLNTVLLLRRISSINWLSIVIAAVVIATTAGIVISGLLHFHPAMAFDFPPGAFHLSRQFFAGLGASTLIAVYDYSGYNTICMIGEEVRNPRRTIPRSIVISIVLVGVLYLTMNISILGVIPWREGMHSDVIVAVFMDRLYGALGAKVSSALILVASFGSVFALLLAFSRVPYGAAVDGHFFSVFAKLHARDRYPVVAVITLGVISALACVFSLGDLINMLIVVQIMLQFMAQCIAVIVLRKRAIRGGDTFRMPLFPLPALIALTGWIYIVVTSGLRYIEIGFALMFIGVFAFLLRSYRVRQWPFEAA